MNLSQERRGDRDVEIGHSRRNRPRPLIVDDRHDAEHAGRDIDLLDLDDPAGWLSIRRGRRHRDLQVPAESPGRPPRIDVVPQGEIVGAFIAGGYARIRPQRNNLAPDLDVDFTAPRNASR